MNIITVPKKNIKYETEKQATLFNVSFLDYENINVAKTTKSSDIKRAEDVFNFIKYDNEKIFASQRDIKYNELFFNNTILNYTKSYYDFLGV